MLNELEGCHYCTCKSYNVVYTGTIRSLAANTKMIRLVFFIKKGITGQVSTLSIKSMSSEMGIKRIEINIE